MKNLRKKSIGFVLTFTLIMAVFMPIVASASSYELNDGDIINSYNITSDVVTLYVGNISVDGTSTLKYLYTDKSVNTETLTEMRKILTSDYASLLPTTAGQVTVSDTSSTILYNQTQFNSLATASQAEISDEATAEANNLSAYNTRKTEWDAVQQAKAYEDPSYTPHAFPEEYVKAFNDTTTYPTTSYFIADNVGTKYTVYIIRNSVMTQVDKYPINRTIIKVVNTSANVVQPQNVGDTATETTYEYIEGANQTYTIGEDGVTFRINADYSLFENGGKVYVDDTLVSSDNYTSKTGSTIITFTKDYMSSLSEGEHTLKVAFNNGGSATTKFTVAKADTATTTKAAAAKTADALPYVGLVLVFMGVFAIAVVSVRRKF